MIRRRISILALLFCCISIISVRADNGGEVDKDTTTGFLFTEDDPILSAIDSLMMMKVFESSEFTTNIKELNTNNYDVDFVPDFPDLVYECRLMELDSKTPIRFDYNEPVQNYIDVYVLKRRDQLSHMLGMAELYFPIFEEYLDKYNLPLELKNLAIVESALNPTARSKSGAVGLWQFLLNTGKMFDLEVNSYVDERMDPFKATQAACEYLEYLYGIFNDWQLALAAYNGGPGTVRNAIIRSGGKTDFWKIRPYLPKETQNYVPAFIAVNYAMSFATEHNIYPTAPKLFYSETDTVSLSNPVYLSGVAKVLGIPLETLKFLNPAYKLDYIPYSKKAMQLVIPVSDVTAFLENEDKIYSYHPDIANYVSLVQNAGSKEGKTPVTHIVSKGEYIHKIAMQYKCSIEDIKTWNQLATNYIYMGKELTIYVEPEFAAEINRKEKEYMEQRLSGSFFYYTIKDGDTLWKIADKFNCDSITDLMKINGLSNESTLYPGTQIKITQASN